MKKLSLFKFILINIIIILLVIYFFSIVIITYSIDLYQKENCKTIVENLEKDIKYCIKNKKTIEDYFKKKKKECIVINRNYLITYSFYSYKYTFTKEIFDKTLKTIYFIYHSPIYRKNFLFYYSKELKKFFIVPFPFEIKYLNFLIKFNLALFFAIFLSATLILWYFIYEYRIYKDIRNIKISLETIETELFDEIKKEFNFAEFEKINIQINKLRFSIIELISRLRYKEKLALVGEINAELSHQIKNSLGGLKSGIEILEKEVKNTDFFPLVKSMKEEIKSLEHISLNFLNLLKPFSLKKKLLNIIKWIKDWEEKQNKKIKFINKFSTEEIFVKFDPIALKHVFDNLLKNSLEIVKSNLEITLEVVEIKNGVWIKFIDNGPGFKNEILRSFVLESSKKDGYGLGLFLCKRIIEAHGGSFIIKNHPYKGAEINIYLYNE